MNVLRTLTLILLLPISAWAAEYSDPSVWARTIGSFNLEDEIIGPRAGDIVATGSSSMLFWDHRIHADLAPLTIISRGFGGSNMNDVLNYLDQLVLKHKPRAVLIYEGDNDVAQGVAVGTILSTFEQVIKRIHSQDGNIRIYLLSVKPSISRTSLWPTMLEVNAGLQKIAADDEDITYIDVATPMLHADGSIRADLLVSDQLHMNQKGYDIWRNTIAPVLFKSEIRYEASPRPQ
jgi:lysophospholipase L1-like esterase